MADPAVRGARATRLRHVVLAILALCVTAYLGALAYLMSQETRLVFKAGRPLGSDRPSFPYEQVLLPRSDSARQFAWIMRSAAPASSATWIVYLHGNASTVASRLNIVHYTQLRALGINVIAPEYRGFAGLDGVPSESTVGSDALAAYDYLRVRERVGPEHIVIYGWSLGSGVAVNLAANVPEAAVILEGAAASLVSIGQQQYPLFPIRLVMRNPFESIRKVARIKAPMLFLHSPEDVVIPIAQGRLLYDAANPPKKFIEVRGGHVEASEVDSAVFFSAIREFLEEHLAAEKAAFVMH